MIRPGRNRHRNGRSSEATEEDWHDWEDALTGGVAKFSSESKTVFYRSRTTPAVKLCTMLATRLIRLRCRRIS